MPIQIRLEGFEGPMDLLLHLIEKAEVDIYDIPIAEITDQYIHAINEMKELNMDVASEFILMAATLLEIKSKMLLPVHKKKNQEEEVEDPREELVRKLIEYKRYKMASEDLKERYDVFEKVFFKEAESHDEFIKPEPLHDMDISVLMEGMDRVLERMTKRKRSKKVREISRDKATVEDQLRFLEGYMLRHRSCYFDDLFEECGDKYEIIVTFMAMLEMMKRKLILVIQEKNFDRIRIELVGGPGGNHGN